ncbi:Endoribonuclease Dicer [Ooceraea biroi]|nr:Endoribonuclease Dicer [Ooceraea biroi]
MILDRVNLIIFDECHRGVAHHPMRQIMQRFEDCPKEKQPRILAMSATLLNANIKPDKIESTIRSLEITFHAKIATVDSPDCIQGYCTNPSETIVTYREYQLPEVVKKITQMVENITDIFNNINLDVDSLYLESSAQMRPKKKLTKLLSIIRDIQVTASHGGIYAGSKSALLHLIQLETLRKQCDDVQKDIVLESLITQVMIMRKLLHDEMKNYPEDEQLYSFTSDQMQKLFAILAEYNNKLLSNQEFCCIIFVKERFMTQVIYHILKVLSELDKRYSFLLPDYITGFQNNPFKNVREVSCVAKWNKEALHRFKTGLSNCMVATDVVDEGIDVAACTLIIRYDMPTDFRGYVQSKGRARHGSSNYIVFMPDNDNRFLQKYKQYKSTEATLKSILVGRTEERTLPTDKDITNNLYTYTIEPYIVEHDGVTSCITEVSAISLINMYCNGLLKSKFVHLVPIWKLYKNEEYNNNTYKVTLQLPSISPLRTIVESDFMNNIIDAKRSAALKSCIKLHELEEFTDNLIPATADAITQNLQHLFPNWVDEDYSLLGTYKRKRPHRLEHPKALYSAFPQSSEQLYLHVLKCTPAYSVMGYDNRRVVFYNLLNDKSGFGILSTKRMAEIPSFPIFMKDGKLNVDVKSNHATMTLSENDIKLLKRFHFLLFTDIIPAIKPFMLFDNDNLENSFLIVPLTENQEINWDVVKTYQCVERIEPSMPFHFRICDYELALVTPTYRGSSNVYVVTRVCDDLTPESPFPNEDFDTFTHYYNEKHELVIQNLQQSMLEVKPIPVKINYIKPRGSLGGSAKYKKADDTVEDLQEHLIPELCWKINFPALYWLKATTLPSILHRVCQLLIAEDLRETIAREAGIGTITLEKLPALTFEGSIEKLRNEHQTNESDLTLDDSIERTQLDQPDLNAPELGDDREPQDLYRNMEQVQVIDIQYYNQFMSVKLNENGTQAQTNKKNIGHYASRPIISTPPLDVLASTKELPHSGPNAIEIMQGLTTKLGVDMFDLERLETLGDSYLKFITSLYLYHTFPKFNEGQLTAVKGKIIGNRNLYYCGNKKGIAGRLKNDAFVPTSNFVVPAFTVLRLLQEILLGESVTPNVLYELRIPDEERYSGYVSEDTRDIMQQTVLKWDKGDIQTGVEHYLGIQILSDKTVADSVEALIGVYLKSNGIRGAAKLLKWFGILSDMQVDEVLNSSSPNPLINAGNIDYHMPWADVMEAKLGYKFNNRAFLLQAFTHPSYTANTLTECYQRLEFLGDAILDFLITCYIYENCGKLSPGDLTDLRSALVNNITFACLAVRYGLHTRLLAFAPKLHEIIDHFVRFQEERDYIVNDELLYVLLEEDDCNLAEHVDVPKVLGDLFESLIGAIYLDSNKNLMKVWEIVYSLMYKEIDEFSKNVPKHPVRVIHENTHARPKFSEATLIEQTGTIMIPLKIIIEGKETIFHGFGINKKQAKCAAAKQALKKLHQLEKKLEV